MLVIVPVFASVCDTELMVGFILVGTLAVNRTVFSPIEVLPLFVVHLIVTVPLVVLGMLLASVKGIVHVCWVVTPVAIDTYALPANE